MQSLQQQLQQQITEYLQHFLEHISLQNCQFPIFSLTFSLWRKTCYRKLYKKYTKHPHQVEIQQINLIFFKLIQHKYLPQFIQKLQIQLDGKKICWKKLLSQQQQLKQLQNQTYQTLILSYSQLIYKQQLYIQMFYDLISITYSKIHQQIKNKQYRLNQKYDSNFYQKKNQSLSDKAVSVLGKNIISKGLTKITEVVLAKSLFYGFTSILSLVNPLMMGVTFAIGLGLENKEKSNKIKEIIDQITMLRNQTEKNVLQLQMLYEQCFCSLEAMNVLEQEELEKQKKKFKKLISNVLVEDWLEIKIQKEDEWEIVEINYKDQYQCKIIDKK